MFAKYRKNAILPAALFTAIVALTPFVLLVWQSLHDLNYFEARNSFFGLKNYLLLLEDKEFLKSLVITFKYAFFSTLFTVLSGFIGGLILYYSRKSLKILPLLIVPFLVAPIVIALIFALLLDGQLGFISKILYSLGFENAQNIIGDKDRIFWAIVFIDAWQWFGIFAFAFYGRIKTIPRVFYEVVVSNGGGNFNKIVDVFCPAMARFVIAMVIFKFIWSMGNVEIIDALTAGGSPYGSMRVFPIWMDRVYFRYTDYGYGASASIIFYIIAIVGVSIFIYLAGRKKEMV